jgi:hypothetical protein
MWPFTKKHTDWNSFNPVLEDGKTASMRDAVDFAGKLIQFCAFLRKVDPAEIDVELRRFFDNGFVGPITLTAREISPLLQKIWQYNSKQLFDDLAKNQSTNPIFLMLLMNEFYFPVNDSMPSYYISIGVSHLNNNYELGVVDRIKFTEEIDIESVLIDAEITKSYKQAYHLDDEFSVYELEYSYSWNNIAYTNADVIKLNTAHLAWANVGGLLNFPKVDFDEKDLDAKLSKGMKIKVYVANDNGLIRNPVYDDIVYEVAKM